LFWGRTWGLGPLERYEDIENRVSSKGDSVLPPWPIQRRGEDPSVPPASDTHCATVYGEKCHFDVKGNLSLFSSSPIINLIIIIIDASFFLTVIELPWLLLVSSLTTL
jgi:hypothetical protein